MFTVFLMLSLDEKRYVFQISSLLKKKMELQKRQCKIIPTLGLTYSHRGNDLVSTWDFDSPNLG